MILRVRKTALAHMLLGVLQGLKKGDCDTNPNHRKDRFVVMIPRLGRIKDHMVDIPFQFPVLNRFRQHQLDA